MERIVQFQNVGVSLGGQRVLSNLDLELVSGQRLGIVGPNGSGKTTLVRTAATLTHVDSGTVLILGADTATANLATVRSGIGLLGHQPALIPELTLHENLTHVARLTGISPNRVDKALDVVGLGAASERWARASSFGMQRRTEIAQLLLTRPRLLLLDEAASGLDESARSLIEALVDSVCARDGAVIVVSHDRLHLSSLCDRVLTLRSGTLVDET